MPGKKGWTGTGNDDFGSYGLNEKNGSKGRELLITYKPGGFSCKYGKHSKEDLFNIQPSGQWSSRLRNRKQTMLKVSKNRPKKMTKILGAITPNVY